MEFDDDGEVRSIKDMLADEEKHGVLERNPGKKASRRSRKFGALAAGAYVAYQLVPSVPQSKEFLVGKVLVTDRNAQTFTLKPQPGKVERRPGHSYPSVSNQEGVQRKFWANSRPRNRGVRSRCDASRNSVGR